MELKRLVLERALRPSEPERIRELAELFPESGRRFAVVAGEGRITPVRMMYGWVPNPDIEIPDDFQSLLASLETSHRRIAEAFVRWELDPDLPSFLNPYEPLLQFFQKGGYWNRFDNGVLKIFDAWGDWVGISRLVW